MSKIDPLLALACIASALTIAFRPDPYGVVALALLLAFTALTLWEKRRPRIDVPELARMRSELEELKGKLDKVILGGRRG